MSSSRLQVMRPEDVYTVHLRLLEMLPSKRLHNALKSLKGNVHRHSESAFKIKKNVFKTSLSQL